jgi:hypothetical protein
MTRKAHGELKAAVRHALADGPLTSAQLAERVGTTPEGARAQAQRLGISLAREQRGPVRWTEPMLEELRRCVQSGVTVDRMAQRVGVAIPSLVRGLAILVRRDKPATVRTATTRARGTRPIQAEGEHPGSA